MDFWSSRLRRAVRWCRRSPRCLTVLLVAVMFATGDRVFPLSSFPMYGDFPDRTYYVYVTNGNGEPIPLFTKFGYKTTFLKRVYNRKVNELVRKMEAEGEEVELHWLTPAQLRPAGDATLEWLVASDRRRKTGGLPAQSLRLEQVNILQRGRELVRETVTVGVYPRGNQ
jgi:hypothetical protein